MLPAAESAAAVAGSHTALAHAHEELAGSDGPPVPIIANSQLSSFDVIWTTPSRDSLGSMPIGDGSTGLNVWVEESGDLLFLMGRSDTPAHNKLGRIRITFSPSLFSNGRSFRQHLDLYNGRMLIDAGPLSLQLWMDASRGDPGRSVIRIEGHSSEPVGIEASFEHWRDVKEVSTPESRSGDVLLATNDDCIAWWQARKHPGFPGELTIGGLLKGAGLGRAGSRKLASSRPLDQINISVHILADGYDAPTEWLRSVKQQAAESDAEPHDALWAQHVDWWHKFWERSYIHLEGFGRAFVVAQRYAIQRFIFACSSRGYFPALYNGSLFKMDFPAGAHLFLAPTESHDPDWRAWGPQYMGQNTRHQYWPLITTGDVDLVQPLARLLRGHLQASRTLVWETMGHAGALLTEISFAEKPNWGPEDLAPLPTARRGRRPKDAPDKKFWHLQYHWLSGLEFTSILLDMYLHTRDRGFLTDVVLPCAEQFILFYEQHYQQMDIRGKRRIYPAGTAETYGKARSSYYKFEQQEDVLNPVTEVSALRYLVGALLELSDSEIGAQSRARWNRLLLELPDVPLKQSRGRKLLAPGERYSPGILCEVAELYAVWPFRQTACWQANDLLPIARQSYYTRRTSLDGSSDEQNWETGGWLPTATYAAVLGLAQEAARLVEMNFADKLPRFVSSGWAADYLERPGRLRFPAFWEPHCDEPPDQDHGGNAMNALQSMLLQWDGRRIFLLPAWPENWDVAFKLHAPFNTTVECEYKMGRVRSLKVTPADRAADVVDRSTMAQRVRTLVEVACADRNYLFDLPPMRDGIAVPDDVAFRPTTGPWLDQFGESIFSVRGGPFEPGTWGGSVFKANMVYLHILQMPDAGLTLPALPLGLISATALTGGEARCEVRDGKWIITTTMKNAIDTVVRIELDGSIESLVMAQTHAASLTTGCVQRASSTRMASQSPSHALEGTSKMFWQPVEDESVSWLEVDLAGQKSFDRAEILLAVPVARTNQRREIRIDVRSGESEWTELLRSQIYGQYWSQRFDSVTASVVRLTFPKGTARAGVREFHLFAPVGSASAQA